MTPLPSGTGWGAPHNTVAFRRCTPLSEANMDLEIITEGCWLALRFGLRVSPVPTGNLSIVEGVYTFGVGKMYHPLEATLVGTPAAGDWQQDVETVLGGD